MNERVYKTMTRAGAWNIVFGVLLIVLGLVIGVMQIIYGGKLLSDRRELTF